MIPVEHWLIQQGPLNIYGSLLRFRNPLEFGTSRACKFSWTNAFAGILLQWIIMMFGFKKRKKTPDEINRLLSLLEENPGDTKSRLMLANLYLESDDQKTAVKEYHTAANQLNIEGLDLEPIAIYRKILSLDAVPLTPESSASLQQAEEFLAKAKRIYQGILQVSSKKVESHDRDDHEREDDSEPAPIETLRDPSQDQVVPKIGSSERAEEQSSNQEDSSSGTSQSGPLRESYRVDGNQGSAGLPDKAVEEKDLQGPVHKLEITPPADSSCPTEDLQIGPRDVQMDDDLETILSDYEGETSTGDSLPPDTSRDLGDEDLSAIPSALQEFLPREESSRPNTTETMPEPFRQEDPDLPYNLGIDYYEMNLIDKAIREFARAHTQGIKPVESLSMLARCYSKKGLFYNASGLIVQTLKLDNLTQEQIDVLRGQLKQIKAKIHSGDFPRLRESDS